MSDPTAAYPTEVLHAGATGADAGSGAGRDDGAGDGTPRRRVRWWLVAALAVVVAAALLVVADLIVRGVTEERVASGIESSLPEGVEGEVHASLGGFSAIWQLMTGRLERLDLSAPELEVQGEPVAVEVSAVGVPTAAGGTVERATGDISLGAASLDALVPTPEGIGSFELGDGVVSFGGSARFFGREFGYTVTATPTAAGDRVLLSPESVELGMDGDTIDLGGTVDRLLGGDPIPVCVAQYLPEGVEVNGVEISPDAVSIRLEASRIALDAASLETTGSC